MDDEIIHKIFGNIPKDKIRIIHLDTNERKVVHQYLDKEYPKLHKVSLRSIHFNSERIHTYIKCYKCNYRNVSLDNYHYGVLENNQDE
jgi:hypothetical protein